ncbi:hypothetical protein [Candidatus Clostridium stratigraminis]|uniref:Uncharacterized protein n=1 Tax=Candidatus Clostridium stratigraminis TaxID=3381661 RepID=A0ABW8T619_9CLOT
MKNKKTMIGGILCVLTIFLTQFVLRATEITNFSVQAIVAIIMGGGILFSVGMLNSKDRIFGFKFNLISAILMFITCLFGSMDFILGEKYPQLAETHRLLSIMIDLLVVVSLLSFVIFLVVAASITAKKNQR